MNEDKIMDKINKNLKIIDNLLMENGFYKYISKVVNIEDGTSQLYDNLKQTQQENARLKDKIERAINILNNPWSFESGNKEVDEITYQKKREVIDLLKEN